MAKFEELYLNVREKAKRDPRLLQNDEWGTNGGASSSFLALTGFIQPHCAKSVNL